MTGKSDHPNLESVHPRVGNWSDAEYWNHISKLPITNSHIDNYMYTVDCIIGDYEEKIKNWDWSLCIFDSTTSISSVFAPDLAADDFVQSALDFDGDQAYTNTTDDDGILEFSTIGLDFEAWPGTQTFCIGDYDPHTTVCLEE